MKGQFGAKSGIKWLWTLHTQAFQGLWLIKDGFKEYLLAFKDGQLCNIQTNDTEHWFCDYLVAQNRLGKDDTKNHSDQNHGPISCVEYVAQTQKLSTGDLVSYLQEFQIELLMSLLNKNHAEFETLPGVEHDYPPLSFSILSVLIKESSKIYTMATDHPNDVLYVRWPSKWNESKMLLSQFQKTTVGSKGSSSKVVCKDYPPSFLKLMQELEILQTKAVDAELSLDELVFTAFTEQAKSQTASERHRISEEDVQSVYLQLGNANYFELLSLDMTATPTQIRDKAIELLSKYGFGTTYEAFSTELKNMCEEIVLRLAKSYATLSDPDTKVAYTDKLKRMQSTNSPKNPGEAFKIQTSLLDPKTQFQKGLAQLKLKQYRQAEDLFQYASDMEAKNATYLAYLHWSQYLQHPEWSNQSSIDILEKSAVKNPQDAFTHHFLGRILCEKGDLAKGLKHLQKAVQLEPKNQDFVSALKKAGAK